MSRFHRPFAAIALACLLVLTAQTMAVARGMAAPVGAVVLCTGTGPVTILTDAEGQPVGPAHICPECTLSLIVALGQSGPAVAHPMRRAMALPLPAGTWQVVRAIRPFSARDPPVLV